MNGAALVQTLVLLQCVCIAEGLMMEALVLLSCCKWALCMLPQSGQECSQARAEPSGV